jgi:hypothetical protein
MAGKSLSNCLAYLVSNSLYSRLLQKQAFYLKRGAKKVILNSAKTGRKAAFALDLGTRGAGVPGDWLYMTRVLGAGNGDDQRGEFFGQHQPLICVCFFFFSCSAVDYSVMSLASAC